MHKKYDNKEIERKWQEKWNKSGIYTVGERDTSKEKEYVLVEWPYPSGNLHIGHWYAFGIPDIYVRFKRMSGIQALYPMGFDAFGLPAENAAIKRNLDPKEWTYANMEYMRSQLDQMGNAFSWDKTTSSTDEDYYFWTQWMFTEFFKKDIAYRGKGIVNWCPSCNTVLANEQVQSDDTCERCGTHVEKKEMDEWKLRITQYADRLIDDLDVLDWPEHIKDAQRKWIGRSKGAEIDFLLNFKKHPTDNDNRGPHGERAALKVFTTRPDTLFGATYVVLAPEHPWVTLALDTSHDVLNNKEEVATYVRAAKQKDERDRLDATKEKTGVCLEGVVAINPATNEELPIFVADYVLGGYGTGAIMAVPAHDDRDFAFAEKFGLSIKKVIDLDIPLPFTQTGKLCQSKEFDGLTTEEAKQQIVKKVGGKMTSTYRLRDWSIGRQRYWGVPIPIVYDPEGNAHPIAKEHLPWRLPQDVDFKPTGEPPLAKSVELKERTERIFGAGWTPEVETMDTFVDSSWYFLRYIDNDNRESFSSLEKQKQWMPIDIYFGGAEHTTMHLLYSRFWQKALFDLGYVTETEPYKKRINRSLVLGPDGNKMSKSKGNVIDPDDHVKTVGADAVKMYLAFMGPYGEVSNYPWDMGGIAGIRRFLERVYGLHEHIVTNESITALKQLHKTIQKVSSDIPLYKFNTAISAFMVYINLVEKEGLSRDSYKLFLRLLAPFAPHLTEELWEAQGEQTSIHTQPFPVADATLTVDEEVTIAVQINGKMRGSLIVGAQAQEAEVLTAVKNTEVFSKYLSGELIRVIYIPGKIINVIVKN